MASGIPRRKTARRRSCDWEFSGMSMADVVCFRTGSPIGEKLNNIEAMKAARKFHGINHTKRLNIDERERLFPNRIWRFPQAK